MGNCCLPVRFRKTSSAVNPKNITLLLVGLDRAGKTTIAKRLAGEPVDSVVPTVGFSVLSLRQKGCRVSIYDLGGGPQIRDIWRRYYADAHGIIFVVDASDMDRLDECAHILQNLLQHEQISGKPVLLLANKQDTEGALDEIDIVDHLNLERIVNEQKCPTLVELCSALHFSKKIDIGINNGYKWLIRGIIRDYPSLNNRVLRDLAKQEEENKVFMIKKKRWREENGGKMGNNHVDVNYYENPFKPVKNVLENKGRMNGIVHCKVHSPPNIPGLVDDQLFETMSGNGKETSRVHRFLGEETVSTGEESCRPTSYSSEFFLFEKFKSDAELLSEVSNQSIKNFLVRPKSSGARLYGIAPEKRKATKRKPLIKGNKTGPSPFTDFAENQKSSRPPLQRTKNIEKNSPLLSPLVISSPTASSSANQLFHAPMMSSRSVRECKSGNEDCRKRCKNFLEDGNPFLVTTSGSRAEERHLGQEMQSFRENRYQTKSTPNSRRNSGKSENTARRRHSTCSFKSDGFIGKTEKVSPLRVNNSLNMTKEILLDVTQLKE